MWNFRQGSGGKVARAAGTVAQLIAKQGKFVTLRLPSKETSCFQKLLGKYWTSWKYRFHKLNNRNSALNKYTIYIGFRGFAWFRHGSACHQRSRGCAGSTGGSFMNN